MATAMAAFDFGDALLIGSPDIAFALEGRQFLFARRNQHARIFDGGRRRRLRYGDARAGRVEQAHRLVRQLPRRDIAVRQLHGRDNGGVRDAHLVVLLHRRQEARAACRSSARPIGLADLDRLEAPGQRRVLLDILAVLRPGGGGDGAQRAARQRRLEQVGGIAGAGGAAGADQRVRLVDEQDDRGRRGLHLVDHRAQPLLELALHRGARLHQADVERAELVAAQRRRHVARGDALREAFDHGGLADARLAGEDRVVLAPPHQHVDDLADFLVAADDRVHLAGRGLGGEVDREAVERRRALGALWPQHLRAIPAALRPEPSIGRRFSSSEFRQILPMLVGQRFDVDLGEFLGDARSATRAVVCSFRQAGQDMAGADLGFAEQQRGIVPAAIEGVDEAFRDARHLGLVGGKIR